MAHDKVRFLVSMLAGFAVGCALINAARWQPLAVMRPSVDLAVQYQPALFSQSKLMQPMQPIKHRASSIIANAEAEAGRREMMAGAFGLAIAARSRAAVALAEDELKGELPKAEDFTNVNKVQYKKGFVAKTPEETSKAGSVELQPLLVPAVVAGAAVVTAGVPALLNAGQTAKDAQDAQFGKGKRKSR